MISNELEALVDRLFGYAAKGRSMEPEVCACMAGVLLDYARTIRIMETLPFEVTLALVDALPEGRLARIAQAPRP